MTKEEIKKIIDILLKCDGGCEYCVADLVKLFCNSFPKYKDLAENMFKNEFGKNFWDIGPHKERNKNET